jgi:hypothetical protein
VDILDLMMVSTLIIGGSFVISHCDISHSILRDDHAPNSQRKRIIGTNSTNREGERYIGHLHRTLLKQNIFQEVEQLKENINIVSEEDKKAVMFFN